MTQVAPPDIQVLFEGLLKAVHQNSYEQLVSKGDSNFEACVTPQMLHGASAQLLPHLSAGYQSSYMGVLDRKSYVSHYWKLSFSDTAGDRLARLSVRDGKVHAFYIL